MKKTGRTKKEHTPLDEDLLHTINENIPAKTCAAHPILLIYMENITKNVNQGFQDITDKIDPINEYIENLSNEQKATRIDVSDIKREIDTIKGKAADINKEADKYEIREDKEFEIRRDTTLRLLAIGVPISITIIGFLLFSKRF
jgi:TolA-binding protein